MNEPIFAADDAAAPPRQNGELVFQAPWESRVFGLAAALRDRGLFAWDEFRVCLIAEIADWQDVVEFEVVPVVEGKTTREALTPLL